MSRTLGIHWAQTTHGTWFHGDSRGSWQNGRLIGLDPFLEASARLRMANDVVRLSSTERRIITAEFGAIVRERKHRILAATIQSTHVHVVFAPLDECIKTVIARFKYRSASAVLRHRRELANACPAETAGLYNRAVSARRVPKSLWTAGQFPVFIFNDLHLGNAIEYVRDHNRRIGLLPDPFDWIEPL
jgi:REP element-mobilizing transposase RayT